MDWFLYDNGLRHERVNTNLLILTLLQKFYSHFIFHLSAIQRFISTWVKSCEVIYHSRPHVPETS